MKYNIKSIPTKYNGIEFRSRLEAKWACFFDLLGWSWSYEPFDLEGWCPDFEIFTNTNRRLLVEVKPVVFGNQMGFQLNHYDKAVNHKESFNILMVGVSPFNFEDFKCIGVLDGWKDSGLCVHEDEKYGSFVSPDYAFLKTDRGKFDNGKYGLSPEHGVWDDWIDRNVEKKGFIQSDKHSTIESYWKQASNEVRYKPFFRAKVATNS